MINDITLECGDSLTLLKTLPDNSVDLVVADPPYFSERFYGTFKRKDKGVVK